jgi:L-ribulose-5-phosphate 3-epimerase
MITISFMTANYVARQVGYHMTEGWGQGDQTTQAHFRPVDTFAARFEEYMRDIQAMGFAAFDLWVGILNPAWATDEHVAVVNDLVARYHLPITTLAGWFGSSQAEFEASCKLAAGLNIPILGGRTGLLETSRKAVIEMLERYGLKLGIENHPEKTPEELLTLIGNDSEGRVGAAVDTGWFGTHGYDASVALDKLQDHLLAVHLKDVLQAGGHETCRYGQGCVPIEECVNVLKRVGYTGSVCVEHEPEHLILPTM